MSKKKEISTSSAKAEDVEPSPVPTLEERMRDLSASINNNVENYNAITSELANEINRVACAPAWASISMYSFGDIEYHIIARGYCEWKYEDKPMTDVFQEHFSVLEDWTCTECDETFTIHDGAPVRIDEHNYCESCSEEYHPCGICQRMSYHSDIFTSLDEADNRESTISWMIENRFLSAECAELILNNETEGAEAICTSCLDHGINGFINRPENSFYRQQSDVIRIEREQRTMYRVGTRGYSTILLGSPEQGDTVKSDRIWSCEIEHYYNNADTKGACEAYATIPSEFGVGHDGSLNSQPTGIEVQTCLLKGKKGEDTLKSALAKFQKAGFTVDQTCGLHIHVDLTQDMNNQSDFEKLAMLKKILAFYLIFEDTIRSFLPSSRRSNRFCKVINGNYSVSKVGKIDLREDLMKYWYSVDYIDEARSRQRGGRYDDTRYYGVNFHCVFSQGNLEIRHHSGTLNAQKVLEWVNLHCRILDWCADPVHTWDNIEELKAKTGKIEKMDQLFKLLDLSEESRAYFVERFRKFDTAISTTYEKDMSIPDKKFSVLGASPSTDTVHNPNELDPCVA